MKGLELSKEFYRRCAAPMMEKVLADILDQLAVGLVGEGSECFGFDDEHSIDHDWGPAFCVWVPDDKLNELRSRVEGLFNFLPETFEGVPSRMVPDKRIGRCGLFGIGEFYSRFTRSKRPPQSVEEWFAIPESFLATCTNGEVFRDDCGEFSAYRQILLDYYPEDVRLKKIAARCGTMAQSGQYNLLRCVKRGDAVASLQALSKFVEATLSLQFLLSKKYMPFYKWAFRGCQDLPAAQGVLAKLQILLNSFNAAGANDPKVLEDKVEAVCVECVSQLRQAGLSSADGDWLMSHAEFIQNRIGNVSIRNLPVLIG
ncbi:DUF4037 domain-containing protein [Maridesulfovibrio sp.]|uniref:DUF4037 domain-containing protein n=1 Tax=Maridesulfovibrio sp. TaxID=2795000 RepID=UPI0029F567DB|nr:DUF4037 domain-containing protein [Maridesulfovibrio sp.]